MTNDPIDKIVRQAQRELTVRKEYKLGEVIQLIERAGLDYRDFVLEDHEVDVVRDGDVITLRQWFRIRPETEEERYLRGLSDAVEALSVDDLRLLTLRLSEILRFGGNCARKLTDARALLARSKLYPAKMLPPF